MNTIYRLKQKGGIQTTPLYFGRGRQKTHGYMWSGEQDVQLGDATFACEMYYHGGDDMTAEEAEHHNVVKGVYYHRKHYDAFWHCLISRNSIWLHKEGWFAGRNPELQAHPLVRGRKNYNLAPDDSYTDEQERELQELGFELIAC